MKIEVSFIAIVFKTITLKLDNNIDLQIISCLHSILISKINCRYCNNYALDFYPYYFLNLITCLIGYPDKIPPTKIPPEKNPPEKISLNAVEREPVETKVLNPNASEASYKPKQRSYRNIFFNIFQNFQFFFHPNFR